MAYKATPVKDLPTQKEIVEKIRQAVAVRESTPAQPSDAYKALVKYNAEKKESAATPKTKERSTVEVAKLAQQKKKEDRIEKKSQVDSLQIKKDRAEKELHDYMHSDERRKKLADQTAQAMLSGAADSTMPHIADEKERRLRDAVERAGAEIDARANARTHEANMSEISSMSNEDRAALEEYVRNEDIRDDPFVVSNPLRYIPYTFKTAKMHATLAEKYGEEKLAKLAETYGRHLHEQDAKKIVEDATEAVGTTGGAIGHNILSVPANAIGGVLGTLGRVDEAFDRTGQYTTLEAYTLGDTLSLYANTVRGATAQNIEGENGGTGRKILSVGYQGAMAAADVIARTYLGGGAFGGATLAATGSFSQTMADAARQGATPEQAALLATSAAFIEAASEKLPLDKLLDVAKGGKQTVKQIAKNALLQAGIEATTEEIALIGTLLTEAAILREKSDYNQNVTAQILLGASPEEARQAAAMNIWNEAVNTALVSAVSGGMYSAGMSGAAQIQSVIDATAADLARKVPKTKKQPLSPGMEQINNAAAQTMGIEPTQQAQPATTDNQMQQPAEQSEALQEVAQSMKNAENGATNRMAETVMNDPAALSQLQQQSGIEVTGTKAERRKAVKDALNRLYGAEQTMGTATTAETSANPPVEQVVAENQSQNPMQNPVAQANNDLIQNDNLQTEQREQPINESQQPPETGTVGAAKSKFRHEVRESGVYANTFANANNADLRAVGEDARAADPNLSRYDVITEEESLEEARLRTGTAQDRYVEHRQLMAKDGWSGADNDTAMRLLTAYRKEGKADRLRELAKKQKEMGTQGGQLSQSFAKYSREDATVAVLDAVEVLEKMGVSDVPKKFWKKGDNEPSRHANVGDPDDYSDTAASRMSNTQQKNTIYSKRHMDKQNFEAWKTSVTKSMLEIANDIEAVQEDDVEAMRGIVRQLAQFRRTTAWFGTKNHLTWNADRILEKMDYDTAKTIAKAQLAMIPDDFRKRSAGETAKTIRIHNMLSALTTTERNTIGNATMGIMDAFSDSTVARAMDVAMSKFTGIRTVGNDLKYGKTYFNTARDAADMAALCVELNIPLASESRYSTGNTRTHTTQSGPLGRFLSVYEKYMKYSLEVTDKFFEGGSTAAVNQSIRDLGAKTGLSEDQISGLAERAGQRRTFKEDRNLSRGAKKVKEGANVMFGAGEVGAGDVLMPFAGVPMDIGQTAIDYSGSGMALGLGEMIDVIKAAKNGDTVIKNKRTGTEMPLEIAQRKAVSDFGRGMTGVGLVALSAAASAVGAIKVHNSKDWEKKGMEQAQNLDGVQANLSAIWRGLTGNDSEGDPMEWRSGEDVVLGMDFLEPFNSAMNIGYMVAQEPDFMSMVKNYPKHAFVGVMEAMSDMPVMTLLSEIQELVQSLGETDEEGNPATMDAVGQVAGTIASSVVPSFIRQTAQTIDPYYRDTYDPNPWKQAGNQLLASIPGASKTLPEKYDGLGNPQKRYDDTTTDGKFMGVLNNLFLPDDVEKIGGNAVTDYLGRLSAETGETSMYPEEQAPYKFTLRGEEIELTGDQRATYQKTYGEKNNELYSGLINHPGFMDLPEDVQIAAFERAKSYANRFAKAAVADYRDVPTETAEELVKSIVNDSVAATFANAFADLTESWDLEYDTTGAKESLAYAYEVYQKMPQEQRDDFYNNASGRVKYYLDARNSGMDTEKFTTLYGEYRDIDASENLNSSQKAHEWATVLEEAVDDRFITEAQKNKLRENMVFRYSFEAETQKFDTMIDAGIATNKAKYVVDLLDGITGTGSWDIDAKKYTVRDIDKREAIAKSLRLTEKEKDTVMKSYMADYDPKDESPERTEVKYEYIREVMGLSAEEYAETYRAYLDEQYKNDKIAAIVNLGYDRAVATKLYYVYYGNQKKVPTVAWYEDKHGL